MLCWSTAFAAERAIKRQTLSSPSPVETPYLSGKYLALVIGNNDYDDPEKLWPSLKTAVADAEAVADILKTDYGFAEITLLKNAKQREIVRAFNKLAKTVQDSDSVLIYYAGHGYLNEDTKEGFWIPVDAEGRDDSTFVPNSTIKTKLSVIADKARHVLLVSDSCFSGALLREGNRGISLDQKNERYYQKVAKKKSVQILAAGGLEFVDDNYKGTGHSPFTYYLLQSLKDNNVRYFEATDLSQETSRNVSVNTMQTPESGVLQGAGHAGGEFFFLRQKTVSATASAAETEKSVSASASVSKPVASAPRKFRADEETWELVKESNDPDDFIFFLDEFPESPLSSVARLKLRKLKKKQKNDDSTQQRLVEEAKRLEEERLRLEAEKKRLTEAKRKVEKEQKKQQELAAGGASGTVTDSSTGLMWEKEPFEFGLNWHGAVEYCNNLELGGFEDWELPTKDDYPGKKSEVLSGLDKIHYGRDEQFWTQSEVESSAWSVDFWTKNQELFELRDKSKEYRVRCVRVGNGNKGYDQIKEKHKPQNNIVALQQRLAESKYLTHVGHYEGNTYAITRSLMNFEEAKALAQEQGGHLATIDGRSENKFLVEHFAPFVRKQPGYTGKGAGRLYMGLIDITKDNDWGWIDKGEELGWFDFRNWNAGQPNNYCKPPFCKETINEDCAVIRIDQEAPGKWHDISCLRSYRAIIEWDEQ